MTDTREYRWTDFLGPRDWLNWLGLLVLRGVALLPLPIIAALGAGLGEILHLTMPRRRHIARTNIRACFPELSPSAQRRLVRAHFRSFTQAALATPISWWGSETRMKRLVHTPGIEHFQRALAAKRPVILLVAHFVAIEVAGMVLAPDFNMIDMYKRPSNRFFDWLIRTRRTRWRSRAGGALIERSEGIKPVIRAMRQGGSFFYLSDQDQGMEGAVFAPFFGIPTATLTALGRLTQLTGAVVIPCFARQLSGGRGYELMFQPPLEDFPTEDALADTTRMNRVIEHAVRLMPEQYFWSHRRFKTRPPGEPEFY